MIDVIALINFTNSQLYTNNLLATIQQNSCESSKKRTGDN